MVTIRPTMTMLPDLGAELAAALGADGLLADKGDEGGLVLLGLQPETRASATNAADNEPNLPRDAVMGHLLRVGDRGRAVRAARASVYSPTCRGLDC